MADGDAGIHRGGRHSCIGLIQAGPLCGQAWHRCRRVLHLGFRPLLHRHRDNEAVAPAVHRPDGPLSPATIPNGFADPRDTIGQRRVRHELLGPELRE